MRSLEVITSGQLEALEDEFVRLVAAARDHGPVSPLTVVVGSNLQHIYLRRLLARRFGAVANIRFLTLLDLAGEVCLRMTPDARRPLPDGADGYLVESAAHGGGATQLLGLDVAGMRDALAATIRDLREGGLLPEQLAIDGVGARTAAIGAVLGRYRALVENFRDRTSLFELAVTADPGTLNATLVDGPVIVYGAYDLNALQRTLVAVIAATRDVSVLIPFEEGEAFSFANPTVEAMKARGFAVRHIGAPAARADTTIFSSADRQAQAEEVGRKVLSDIEAGVPPSDIAVLHRLDQRQDELVGGVLERAGVPFYLAAGRPIRRTAVGRAALALLALTMDTPSRGTLLELLSLPCISLNWVQQNLTSKPTSWERLSKELGLVRGWPEFHAALALHAQYEGEDERNAYSRELARQLLSVVDALHQRASEITAAMTWSAGTAAFTGLLQDSLRLGAEPASVTTVLDRLVALAALDDLGVPFSLERLRDAAERAIRQAVVSGGYFQRDGVFVGSVTAARGLRFSRVYVVECAERVFPALVRQDPLLPDAQRSFINSRSDDGAFVPLRADRLLEERLLFELACQAARDGLILSYSRRANISGAPRLPSSFLLEEAARLASEFTPLRTLESSGNEWFRRLPARIAFDASSVDDSLRALDVSDLRCHMLEQGGRRAWREARPLWPLYDRLVELKRARAIRTPRGQVRRFGQFDGIVGAELAAASGTLDRDLSPTSISNYVACPYRFFMEKVLDLRAVEEPERTLEIAPAARGDLVHRILELFVRRYEETGGDWGEFLANADPLLDELLEREFAELSDGVIGLPVVRQTVREVITGEIREYLQQQREDAAEGWRPIATERWFDGLPLPPEDPAVTVRGRIDRVDRRGDSVRVVDYKTGVWREAADGYRQGKALQLPLYLFAATRAEATSPDQGVAEFHYINSRTGNARVSLHGADLVPDDRFPAMLRAFRDGVASGAFFYNPGPKRRNCKICSFARVCDATVEEQFNRKAAGSRDLMQHWMRTTGGRE